MIRENSVALQWANQCRDLTLSATGEFANDLSVPQSLRVPASWHFPVPPCMFVLAKAKLHFQIHNIYLLLEKKITSCLLCKTQEETRGKDPFLVHDPMVSPQVLCGAQCRAMRWWQNSWSGKLCWTFVTYHTGYLLEFTESCPTQNTT